MAEPRVIRNDDKRQYEIWVDDTRAGFAQFRTRPGRILFIHTVIDEAFEGQGLGSLLAHSALNDTVARGETIVPYCPFFAAYLRRHIEYNDHVEWPAPDDAHSGPVSVAT